jgi:3-oxoacyl-[acyl-carrier-protein] synthase-3
MDGNSAYRHSNTAILSVTAAEAPRIVTSAWIEEQLTDTLRRLGLRPGLLEGLAGIRERRWWPDGVRFVDAAVEAGDKAIAEAGIDRSRIGVMVNSSVSKENLEPSAAVEIHHRLGLPSACTNFDLSNACLGFVNAMHLAATMIDAGHIEYALVVDGEDSRPVQERTLERLRGGDASTPEVMSQFATLTLGSGGAAMVLGRADEHPEGHRLVGGISRAATEHHELCVGDNELMHTDTKGLLDAGLELAEAAWREALVDNDWKDMDCYVLHQVSQVHTSALCDRLSIDPDRAPLTFPEFGNIGPASVPFTLARQVDRLSPGDRVLAMGIGSGLNTAFCEITW